jgi:type II secretory pathway pseudopilin PulG
MARAKNCSGYSMLEVLVSIGIGIIGVIAATSYFNSLQKATGKETTELEMKKVAANIEKYVREEGTFFRALQFGASANTALRNCLDATSVAPCTITNSMDQVGFDLYDASGKRISGTPSDPVFYSRSGAPNCDPSTPGCPFWRAVTYFWARCANGTVCDRANTLYIRYQLLPENPTYEGIPLNAFFDPVKFNAPPKDSNAISHKLSRALEWGQTCPVGSEQVGFESGGKLQCKCRFDAPQVGVDAQGQPICDVLDYVCPNETIMQGNDTTGKPICRMVTTVCNPSYPLADENAQCPNGGWMTGLNLGRCAAGAGIKKGFSRGIKCDVNRAHCCWFQPQPTFLPAVPQ